MRNACPRVSTTKLGTARHEAVISVYIAGQAEAVTSIYLALYEMPLIDEEIYESQSAGGTAG